MHLKNSSPTPFRLVVVLAILGLTTTVAAQPKEAAQTTDKLNAEAKQHFRQGLDLYQRGRYQDAITEFNAAYRAKPHGFILYNLAQCHEKLGDFAVSLRNYREYLRQVPDAPDRSQIVQVMAKLERRLGEKKIQQVIIETVPTGATLSIDGQEVGRAPWIEELRFGAYQIDAELPGYKHANRTLVLDSNVAVEVRLVLEEAPRVVEAPIADLSKKSGTPKWVWAAAGAGGALATGIIFGLLASSSSSELRSAVHDQPTAQRLHDSALTQSRISNISYGISGAALVAGAALFVVQGEF
jgi:tetratricopeptide (TPR) repeat protein